MHLRIRPTIMMLECLILQVIEIKNQQIVKFSYLGIKTFVANNNIKLIADGGYPASNPFLIVTMTSNGIQWNHQQKALRSVVEVVNGLVKNFEVAALTF